MVISFLFSQEIIEPVLLDEGIIEECPPCEEPCLGTCLSEEETKNLFNNIQECEFNLEKCSKINENLNEQIYMYIQTIENDSLLIVDYKKQIKLKEDMIDLVKPKWYENKWIWFGLGVTFTSGSVYLAGQIGN
jgi:hypothetical protein